MANGFNSPNSQAARPGHTVETLSRYRSAHVQAAEEYASLVEAFYDLITDFYEFGWAQSFHFAPTTDGVSFKGSIESISNISPKPWA